MRQREHQIQVALFKWAALAKCEYPDLGLMFAIPNGGARTAVTGAMLKAEGVKAGVPDIMIPAPREPMHGLFLEMKTATGKVSQQQRQWINDLRCAGYRVEVCHSLDEAMKAIVDYLN